MWLYHLLKHTYLHRTLCPLVFQQVIILYMGRFSLSLPLFTSYPWLIATDPSIWCVNILAFLEAMVCYYSDSYNRLGGKDSVLNKMATHFRHLLEKVSLIVQSVVSFSPSFHVSIGLHHVIKVGDRGLPAAISSEKHILKVNQADVLTFTKITQVCIIFFF